MIELELVEGKGKHASLYIDLSASFEEPDWSFVGHLASALGLMFCDVDEEDPEDVHVDAISDLGRQAQER